MIKFLRKYKLPICIAILSNIISNVAIAAESSPINSPLNSTLFSVKDVSIQPDSEQEALSVANQFKAIVKALEAEREHLIALSASQSIFSIDMTTKLRAIVNAIEFQRKNLVDFAMHESATNTNDSGKLNSIVNALESQRKALSDLLFPQLEQAPVASINSDEMKSSKASLQVFT